MEFFILNDADCLCNDIGHDIHKGFFSQPFSEVVECVMFRGITKSESTEIGEFWNIFKFSCQVSFRRGITEIYKEECLKEAYGIIPLSTQSVIFILIFNKIMDKREVNTFKDDLYGVIRFYGFGDEVINKMRSSVLVHGILLLLTCKRIPVFGGNVNMEHAKTYVKPYVWY